MSCKVLVLDSSAFIMGYDSLMIEEKQYTTPLVREELVGENFTWLRFKMAYETGKLKLLSPSAKAIKIIIKTAKTTGDLERLSEVDTEVLAVAEDLRDEGFSPIIISDDYSIQNVANQLKLEYAPLSTLGIRYRFRWIYYCPACRRKYPQNTSTKECSVCGTPLKKRAIKRSLAKKRM